MRHTFALTALATLAACSPANYRPAIDASVAADVWQVVEDERRVLLAWLAALG
jgi:hypothetical protein